MKISSSHIVVAAALQSKVGQGLTKKKEEEEEERKKKGKDDKIYERGCNRK